MIIEDGTTGRVTGVTEDNELKVRSVNVPMDHFYSSEYSNTYLFYSQATTDGSNNCIMHIQNNGTVDHLLSVMRPCCTTNATWGLYGGGAYSAGGALNSGLNLNTNSLKATDLVVYTGDAITETGAQQVAGIVTAANQVPAEFSMEKSLILGPAKTISFYCNAPAGTAHLYLLMMKYASL